MIVKTPNDTYVVKWTHIRREVPSHCNGITECSIKADGTGYITIDQAVCSRHDQYNKNIGRKQSLAKALKDFDYDERKLFWEKYKEEIGVK